MWTSLTYVSVYERYEQVLLPYKMHVFLPTSVWVMFGCVGLQLSVERGLILAAL